MVPIRTLALLALTVVLWAADPWTPRPGLVVQPDGRIHAGGLSLELQHYDAAWKVSTPKHALLGSGTRSGNEWRLEAPWNTAAGPARLTQVMRPAGDDAVEFTAALTGAGETRSFALTVLLEGASYRGGELRIDGRSVVLPVESSEPVLRAGAPARLVAVPLPSGGWLELAGELSVMVQDNQRWGGNSFSVRVQADQDLKLATRLRLRPFAVQALSLGSAATTPRRDETAGDRIGGWTDQGDNDLRLLAAGPLTAAGLPFLVGDSAAVVGAQRFDWLKPTTVIPVEGRSGACLYLLHAVAWAPKGQAPIGTVTAVYRDGTSAKLEVVCNRDVADWWNPRERLPNGALAWSGDNASARVGLYASRFPISDKPLDRIELAMTANAIWMVVGAALGEDAPLPAQAPDILLEGPRWRPVDMSWEVEPGSALDLSSMTVAPLPGRVVAKGADLVQEQGGAKVRLLGANLCFTANFPEKPVAERMARAFRAMGHNTVRFHHMDNGMVKKGGDGLEFDAEQLDRLDYLFACCKKEGLWITTDVYISRQLPKGAIPELPNKSIGQEFKALVPLLPSAMENWKRFCTAFLTHRNPYTGLSWGEDPALATLSLINEDNYPSAARRDPEVQALVEERFASWLATQPEAVRAPEMRERSRSGWMRRLQADACDAMRAHVRSLGVTVPTTSANMQTDWWSLAVRDRFDFVDNHAYHDHPHFPVQNWRLPFAFNQQSAVERMLAVPASLAHTRRLDRPFTVTELNYCLPNHRRAEYAAGAAAVAGLQDWNGVWRFAFSHDIKQVTETGHASGFDLCRDPIALLGERAMARLYRRGDVAPAPWSAALVYDPAVAEGHPWQEPARSVTALALHARVGCLPAASAQTAVVSDLRCLLQDVDKGGAAPSGSRPVFTADQELPAALTAARLVPAGAIDLVARKVRSADGQIELDAAAGQLLVATRRSVAAVLPPGAQVTVGGIALANPDQEPATVVVAAIDEAPLASSRRVLVLHLTDAQNSGVRFGDRRHSLVEAWGKAPVLVRAGAIQVRLPGATAATAHALDLRGVRRESVALVADGDGQRLDAAVVRAWGATLAWEIVR
jgi:hypothetical protein